VGPCDLGKPHGQRPTRGSPTKCCTGPRTASCEDGDEPSGVTKSGEFVEWLSDYQLLEDYALCSTVNVHSDATSRHARTASGL
jgi:hypothetical protein